MTTVNLLQDKMVRQAILELVEEIIKLKQIVKKLQKDDDVK